MRQTYDVMGMMFQSRSKALAYSVEMWLTANGRQDVDASGDVTGEREFDEAVQWVEQSFEGTTDVDPDRDRIKEAIEDFGVSVEVDV